MKKLIVTLVIIPVAVIRMHAQEGGTAVVLLNYNTVKKKVEKSNEEIQDPKKNIKPATWMKRGELFQDVFHVRPGTTSGRDGINTVIFFIKNP